MLRLKGTYTALITPFEDGKVDADGLKRLLDLQLEAGVNGIVALGTTGEPATMSEEEKTAVLSIVVKHVGGAVPTIAGIGSNCTAAAVQKAVWAQQLGADGLLAVTPYYNKCTQNGLIRHFEQIASATPLPVVCYNVPGRTGVNLLPETFAKICRIPNVIAVKEASGNMEQIEHTLRLCADNADVLSGDDAMTVPIMAMGGTGVISVASNVAPKIVRTMTDAALGGDFERARALQLDLLPLIKALFCEVNPIPVKKALELLGLPSGAPRLPLTPLSPPLVPALRSALSNLSLL